MTRNETTRAWLEAQWALPPAVFHVDVNGASIAVRGWNLETELPGLVLVHGFRAHARWWDHIAPSLCNAHRVVAFDLSGMGDSDRRPAYTVAQYAREIHAVADAAGMVRPVVVGHSFGGLCAMIACRQKPSFAGRLIVIDSPLPAEPRSARRIVTPPRRIYPSRQAGIERFRLIPPGGRFPPDLFAYVAAHSLRRDADGWTWKFDPDETANASLQMEEYRDSLLDLPVAADAIYGAWSEVLTPAVQNQIELMLPHCRQFMLLPECHHHVPIEQPLALINALQRLLADSR